MSGLLTNVGVLRCLAVAGASALGLAQANAAFSPVAGPSNGEASHEEILEAVYGGDWNPSGLDFNNNGLSATRVDDDNDQLFDVDTFSARAVARYAGFSQNFGYFSGGEYNELFDVEGSGTNVTGAANNVDPPGSQVNFGRGGGGGTFDSRAPNNPAGDHLVTYRIDGLDNGAETTWLLFWEDLPLVGADRDFQDLVVEVRASVIPLPAAVWSGVATLMGTGAMGYIRRRRRGQ